MLYFLKTHKRSILRPEKYGDWTTAEHNKILNGGRESPNNHRYAVVVQVLAITSQETENNLRKFQEPSQQLIRICQILWRIIMESSNNYTSSIRDKRNCRTSSYYCNLGRMISGSRISWNQSERRFGESFWDTLCSRRIWEEDILIEKLAASETFVSQEIECERSFDNPIRWKILIYCDSWFSKMIRKRLRIPREPTNYQGETTNSKNPLTLRREPTVRRERISAENLKVTGKSFRLEETKDDEGVNEVFWAHAEVRKEFHVSSSYWTMKFTLRAERRIILYFQDLH